MAAVGQNVELKVKDGKLTITVDLAKDFGPSASGKTIMIASSKGNVAIPGFEEMKLGLNVYKKR